MPTQTPLVAPMPPIVIYWIVYGVINRCESIETTFEIITFVVNPFRPINNDITKFGQKGICFSNNKIFIFLYIFELLDTLK